MRKRWLVGAGMVFIFVFTFNVHAQETAAPDSIVQLTAQAQGLSLVSPGDLPENGTFWLVTTNGVTAPLPCPPFDASLPVYAITNGQFLVDATDGQVDTDGQPSVADAVAALANAVVNLINQVQAAQSQPAVHNQMSSGVHALDEGGGFTPALSLDTNGLFLQINGVTNGVVSLNLFNGDDTIYAVWGSTNLATPLADWQVETELWPTNGTTNTLPFTVNAGDNANLFLVAQDWEGVDSDSDSIPDWWVWLYWGTTHLTDTNLDYSGSGNTFGQDYSNNVPPTTFQFIAIQATNNYANNMSVPLQLDVAGEPYYIAVSIDDTNYANDAVWNNYTSSNVTVNLGLTEGWHDVWVGLRGHANDVSAAVWQWKRLKLDLTPPLLVITNPTVNVVSQPMVELQGYSPEALSGISYDLTNADGWVTNQAVFVTGQSYSTNTWEFTTNYFQCYDIPLTNGLNTITLHATDLAGNVTTTNFNFTPDYSGVTNPPVLNIIWPQDGAVIAGDSFNLQATVDDDTATVTATITDTSGDTNVIQGLVERDGNVTIGGLPLSAGTNHLTVSATDAADNTATTNLTLTQSALTVTVNPVSGDQLYQSSVTVTGTISDTNEDTGIQVNGVDAYYTDANGDWTATNVPVNDTGTMSFDVELSNAGGSVNLGSQSFFQFLPPYPTLANYQSDISWNGAVNGGLDLLWNYLAGGSYDVGIEGELVAGDTNLYFIVGDEALPPVGTDYWTATTGYSYTEYNADGQEVSGDGIGGQMPGYPTWQNGQITLTQGGYSVQKSIQSTLMIVPAGPKIPGVTKTYTVGVCAKYFSDPGGDDLTFSELLGYDFGDTPLPPGELLLNGQPLGNSGMTNDNEAGFWAGTPPNYVGTVWGTNTVTAPAGALVPLYVTTTGGAYDYTFDAQIVQDKLYWQNMVEAEIDNDSSVVIENYLAGNVFLNNRQNIKAVYAFYQKLFTQNTNFLWAGLAKLAGAPVYAGLSDAEYAKTGLLISGSLISASEAEQFQQTLIQMNINILNDLAWQFEAYKNGGLAAIQTAYAYGNSDLDSPATNAWGEINQGIQTGNASLIQLGNEDLLQREQQIVLADGYTLLNAMPGVSSLMSSMAKNPVPTGFDFSTIEPDGNICVYADRWDWITKPTYGMWWLWIDNYTSQQLEWVEIPLKTRAADYSFFSLLPLF